MAHANHIVATAVLGIVMAAGIGGAALAASQGDLIQPVTKPLTFVWVPKLIHPWYEEVQNGANFAIAELKKRGVEVKLIWDAPPQADVVDQNKRIETDIGTHPDGLAVSCLDPATNTQLLGEAVKAKLNVITFDTFCKNTFPFVGHQLDEDDGYRVGKVLAEKLGGKGKVGILSGSLTATNHVNRVKGFKRAMAEYPNIQVVFERPDNDDLPTAVTLTENALQANPDLNAVFGCNASNPIGAARAITNAGKAGKVLVVGFDDLPETLQFIKDGGIYATAAQRQWEIGYWGIYYLLAQYQNHTIPMIHETGSRIITKSDL
jgi:ribose transport system substrate-binding protein